MEDTKMGYIDIYNEWLASDVVDEASKAELRAIADDEKEIEERFYRGLEFGTAGMRGIIGAGTNKINIYNVRQASYGVSVYVNNNGTEAAKKGVLIGAIIRQKQVIVPSGQDCLKPGDFVIVVTTRKGIHSIQGILE